MDPMGWVRWRTRTVEGRGEVAERSRRGWEDEASMGELASGGGYEADRSERDEPAEEVEARSYSESEVACRLDRY